MCVQGVRSGHGALLFFALAVRLVHPSGVGADAKKKENKPEVAHCLTAITEGGKFAASVEYTRGKTIFYQDNTSGKKASIDLEKLSLPTPTHLAISPDGKLAAFGEGGKVAIVRILPKPVVQATFRTTRSLRGLAFSSDSKVLAAGGEKEFVLVDPKSGDKLRTVAGFKEEVTALSFSPDGKSVLAGTYEGRCQLWSVQTGKRHWEVTHQRDEVTCVSFFPDGKSLAVGSQDGQVRILDPKTGNSWRSYQAHRRTLIHLSVSPEGKHIATSALDRSVVVWDIEKAKSVAKVTVKVAGATIAFGKGHVFIADGPEVRLFDLKTKRLGSLREVE